MNRIKKETGDEEGSDVDEGQKRERAARRWR